MPREYEHCKQSELDSGKSLKDAKRICAIRYYKIHGQTPMQADKEGKAAEKSQYDDDEIKFFEMLELIAPIVDAEAAVWTTAYINDLPDSCFLYVEPGEKKDGKTNPLSKRHFPYKDKSGKIDLPHLRNAIARIPQSNAPGLSPEKKKSLQERARRLLGGQKDEE
jgi:hypothetical protein